MEGCEYKLLLHGIDTLQCAYFLRPGQKNKIDFEWLGKEKERIKNGKHRNPTPIKLGNSDFLLFPYGTSSGYPFVISNQDFKIELGELNSPNFYVTFPSQALWRESAFLLHKKFLEWAVSVGYVPYIDERLSRVDFSFDYLIPEIDFDEDCFVSRSSKDSQYRENKKIQTFTLGKGDIVLRVYDKVEEIKQSSEKVWFYLLWGHEKDVWRIEWQVRKAVLKKLGIISFKDLEAQQGDLLRHLSHEHDTLRVPNKDSNSSRWPLHPLWEDLQENIKKLNHLGVCRVYGENAALEERKTRIGIALYGYLKRLGAIQCVKENKEFTDFGLALETMGDLLSEIHDPMTWKMDVERRIKEMQLGRW